MGMEYRAVFSYPPSILGRTDRGYGPPRASKGEAERDQPWRSEESRGWRSGVQEREVSPWKDLTAPEDP